MKRSTMKRSTTANRILSLALALVLLAGLMPATAWAADESERSRAEALGLMPESPQETITAGAFFGLLDKVVLLSGESNLAGFRALSATARASGAELNRYDGMVAVYLAAEAMGADAFNTDWMPLHEQIGMETCWDTIHWNGELYGEGRDRVVVEGFTLDAAAYFYSFGRASLYSGNTLFDYDAASNSMGTDQPLTGEAAGLAALRLYDSLESCFPVIDRAAEEDRALLEAAGERRAAILNSENTVWPDETDGTVYYLSNSGSDDNDGLTPGTAWATLDKLEAESWQLAPGDAVLFERGGLWRGHIGARAGVTYSAYGQGEKPRIYASPESGAGEEKWSLWYDRDGVRIWKYHAKLQDPGGVVMNDGEAYASRVYSYWNGEQAVFWDEPERAFDIAAALEHDLQFYCDYPEDIASRELPFWAMDAEMHGDLYLRCDGGNPGGLYDSIEFQCPGQPQGYTGIIQAWGDGVVVDNLCLMYNNTMAVASGSTDNMTVQNCHIAFVGGGSHIIGYEQGFVPVSGEGIRLDGWGNTAVNNYVHDCFDGGIIFEPDLQTDLDETIPDELLEQKWGEITIQGNLIERCNSGVLVGVHCEDEVMPEVSTLTIRDNQILYSGYGWSGHGHYDYTWGSREYTGNAITFWDDDYSHGAYTVEGNLLYVAKAALVHMALTGENAPAFSGNTYAQNRNGWAFWLSGQAMTAYSQAQVEGLCREALGDRAAVVPAFTPEEGVRLAGASYDPQEKAVRVSVLHPVPVRLVVAVYDLSGRLLGLRVQEVGADATSYSVPLDAGTLPGAGYGKVFLLDSEKSWTPLCQALPFPLPAGT